MMRRRSEGCFGACGGRGRSESFGPSGFGSGSLTLASRAPQGAVPWLGFEETTWAPLFLRQTSRGLCSGKLRCPCELRRSQTSFSEALQAAARRGKSSRNWSKQQLLHGCPLSLSQSRWFVLPLVLISEGFRQPVCASVVQRSHAQLPTPSARTRERISKELEHSFYYLLSIALNSNRLPVTNHRLGLLGTGLRDVSWRSRRSSSSRRRLEDICASVPISWNPRPKKSTEAEGKQEYLYTGHVWEPSDGRTFGLQAA